MIKAIKLGLAGIAVAAASLFMAPPAMAQTSVTCANAPTGTVTGNIIIVDTTPNCVIANNLTATQNISIQATGTITAKALTLSPATGESYGSIYINGASSIDITGAIKATPSSISGGGHIVINAGTTLKASTITTSLGGDVDLEVQKTSGNSPFVIGTSGTNGVGKISTSGNNISGTDYTTETSTVVYVVNGPANGTGTGGITLISMTDLAVVDGGGSRGGAIILNAENGPLKIPAGTMTVASTSTSPPIGGGQIHFMANTVTFAGTTTLNASQTAVTPYNHQINISAAAINYTGNLTLNSNGNGSTVQPAGQADVDLLCQNQLVVSDTQTVDPVTNLLTDLQIYVSGSGLPFSALSISGTGSLTAEADGNDTQVVIEGYPIAVSGTTLTLESEGAIDPNGYPYHGVYISNGGAASGQPGVTFTNTGAITLNANGVATAPSTTVAGGYVYVNGDKVTFPGVSLTMEANAPSSGNGDGGIVYVSAASALNLPLPSSIQANAASTGSGNAQTALLVPILNPANPTMPYPAITITGGNGSSINLNAVAANGGKTSGNGGAVVINAGTGSLLLETEISALALANLSASNFGNGGSVSITGGAVTLNGVEILTDGGRLSGSGGPVSISAENLTASASGSSVITNALAGPAGNITVNSGTGLNLGGVDFQAASGAGAGATVSLTYQGSGTLTLASVSVSTTATGTPGTINIQNTVDSDMTIVANGIAAQGNGTSDNLLTNAGLINLLPANSTADNISLTAAEDGAVGNINATGASFYFGSTEVSAIGLDNVEATNGDVTVCASTSGSCTVAAVAATTPRATPQQTTLSQIVGGPQVTAPNGDITITGDNCSTAPVTGGGNGYVFTPGNNITIDCQTFTFADNTYILGGSGQVTMESPSGHGLTLSLPNDGAQAGFKSTQNVLIQGDTSLTIQPVDGTGTGQLILETAQVAQLESTGGNTTITSIVIGGPAAGTNVPNPALSPYQLLISSSGAGNINVPSSGATAFFAVSNVSVQSSGTLTEQGALVTAGIAGSAPGTVSMTSAGAMTVGGNVITNNSPPSGIPGIAFTSGSTFTGSGSAVYQALWDGTNPAAISIQAASTINLGAGELIQGYGQVVIFSDASLSTGNTVPETYPANVIYSGPTPPNQVTQSNGGTVYWGDTTVRVTGVKVQPNDSQLKFIANEFNLVFDANNAFINVGAGVIFHAGP